ncbi:MAG: peptide chain release factor 1 [Deltaproteobacteria bacterium]|nr:peptide chain release factor 1 [Deltaproteobacteria bacterium]
MFEKLIKIQKKYFDLNELLTHPEVLQDSQEYQRLSKERSGLEELALTYGEYSEVVRGIAENDRFLKGGDLELRDLAQEELAILEARKADLEERLRILLLPKDPNDSKNVLLEIRAGAGGDEASLFAFELFRMYGRYAERKGWRVEILSESTTGLRGYKEVIALIEGKGAYSRLKYESGVHRVQRVPVTEASGRIHTSTVTVAVLPEAEEVDVEIDPKELRIDVFRSSGPGGQSVNTTDSAVRVTHLPTGLVVACQDEKSQHKNKAKALKILRSRLFDRLMQEQQETIAKERRSQVGTGDRSEKIRTYNFPQSRVTDHRIGLNLRQLAEVMDGGLDGLVEPLVTYFQTEALKGAR